MKETGLMFKAPLVRAILEGRKTQTRRIVKGVKHFPDWGSAVGMAGGAWRYGSPAALGLAERGDNWSVTLDDDHLKRMCTREAYGWGAGAGCPMGQPGDRIYVRETYFAWGHWETRFSQEKGRDEWHFIDLTLQSGRAHEFYDPLLGKLRRRGQTGPGATWWKRPGILMPKGAARIWLEISGVRVERLQEINEVDAMAEGASLKNSPAAHLTNYRRGFQEIWESTGGDWAANPWVWVIDFKTISTTGRPA